eukprot:9595590-Alexandrium_andersonii.AAC.1
MAGRGPFALRSQPALAPLARALRKRACAQQGVCRVGPHFRRLRATWAGSWPRCALLGQLLALPRPVWQRAHMRIAT